MTGLEPPPLRDDCFALPAGVDWTPVDSALSLLKSRLAPVANAATLPLGDAHGRVLAENVAAKRANPPLPNSAVDGYGFAHDSLTGGIQRLALVEGRAAAGNSFRDRVPAGHAVRILTGASLPEGVDTVVLQEDVTPGHGEIAFRSGIRKSANTRKAGEDVACGETILKSGRIVMPADLALAAATGHGEINVYEQLRVAIMSTGDELEEPGGNLSSDRIFDANRPMLSGLVSRSGYMPIDMGRVPDDRNLLRRRLDEAAGKAHAIITSGGASAGDEDHVSALLNDEGAMTQWRIAIKPGRPLALGLWKGIPVFGLPGNPVAALVCTLIFARPALGLLAGQNWFEPQGYMLPAGFAKSSKRGRREFLRARVRNGHVEAFKSEGSGRISGLSWAEGLAELPDEAFEVHPGMMVRYIPFANFL
ncbi:MAG: molybdopterin-binding protein [Roseovarius sp.]|nr:molybdopterin-binding protein [Roseovarius sp.]